MQLRKIFAIVLVAIMMFSLTAFAIAAEGEEPTAAKTEISSSLAGENNVVKPGDTVSLSFTVNNNSGFESIYIELPYDNTKLEFVSIENGTVFSLEDTIDWENAHIAEESLILLQYFKPGTAVKTNGVLFTVTFKSLVDGDVALPEIALISGQKESGEILFNDGFDFKAEHDVIKSHDYKSESIPANCTEDAKTVYTCTCGDTYEIVDEGSATGHSFGEWSLVKEPTEKEEGLEERKCSCGETEQRTLSKIPSSPSDNTTTVVIIIVVAVVVIGVVATIIVLKKKELI